MESAVSPDVIMHIMYTVFGQNLCSSIKVYSLHLVSAGCPLAVRVKAGISYIPWMSSKVCDRRRIKKNKRLLLLYSLS